MLNGTEKITDKYFWSDPQSKTAFPVERAGYPFIFAAAFATAVFALLGLTVGALLGLLITFFFCFFFRDPDRIIPNDKHAIVSPADGKVVLAQRVDSGPYVEGPSMKVSIFMSLFNVHVNRIPGEGIVKQICYNPGKFLAAYKEKASMDNEQNAVFINSPDGEQICMVQIAGIVARRIISRVRQGDSVRRGEKMGMICFGSRLDVYLPETSRLVVKKGEKVRSGSSVLGYLK